MRGWTKSAGVWWPTMTRMVRSFLFRAPSFSKPRLELSRFNHARLLRAPSTFHHPKTKHTNNLQSPSRCQAGKAYTKYRLSAEAWHVPESAEQASKCSRPRLCRPSRTPLSVAQSVDTAATKQPMPAARKDTPQIHTLTHIHGQGLVAATKHPKKQA